MTRGPARLLRSSLAGLGLAALACLASCESRAGDARPDVVLVTIDTLRPDYLGFLGFAHDSAPFLGSLAESSVVLERAVSTSSWTTPATASLFSGVYPNRHKLLAGLRAHAKVGDATSETIRLHSIHASLATLPELFSRAGYSTSGLASNPNIREELGFTRGFERFECRPAATLDELIGTLKGWLPVRREDAPRFVYLHLNDVHEPYWGREPWYESSPDPLEDDRRRYLSEIAYVDDQLEGLFEHYGWDEDAVVMVVSDHGEEFCEHGRNGHGFSLHVELNRTLFLFRSPRPGFEPTRVFARASLIDAMPTLLELAGIRPPAALDGLSLVALGVPAQRGALESRLEARTLLAHRQQLGSGRNLWAAMRGPWKLIVDDDGGPARLYNQATDPGELADVWLPDSELVQPLLDEIQTYRDIADSSESSGEQEMELDSALLDQLRELGYVVGE